MDGKEDLLRKVEFLQGLVVEKVTDGYNTANNKEYEEVRGELLLNPSTKRLLPGFVKTCRNLSQIWGYVKKEGLEKYQERRSFIWEQFTPLIQKLERQTVSPSDDFIEQDFTRLNLEHINHTWQRALERRTENPEAAMTSARTLLESVCKYILDDLGVSYKNGEKLPKLYRLTAQQLNLAPSQHTEQIFKQILGGCQTVIEGLGAVRNKLSDSHGKGKKPVKPAPRHAELAVNLAGTMSVFLVKTWEVMIKEAEN